MSEGRIRVDYDNALAQAAKLDELSEQCQKQYKNMGRVVNSIPDSWKGSSGELIQEKCQAWINYQLQLSLRLKDEANSIRKIVNDLKEADNKTVEVISGGGFR